MTPRFALLVALVCALTAALPHEDSEGFEEQTTELMTQVLAAVSSKTSNESSLEKLCAMINTVEASVNKLGTQESSNFDYEVAKLRRELTETKANLTRVRMEFNLTAFQLSSQIDKSKIIPQQLTDSNNRQAELTRQVELLRRECEQDIQGQRLRQEAVKSDLTVLNEALAHLSALKSVNGAASVALLEVSESSELSKCKTLPEMSGPVARCQNGFVVPLKEDNGTISTLPPGNGMAYHRNLQCAFHIAPRGANIRDRIQLKFLGIDTLEGVDFIKVYDGAEPTQQSSWNILG